MFQFLDEQALAADRSQGMIQHLVALGLHAQQFRAHARFPVQCVGDQFGLPDSQRAAAGGDTAEGRAHGVNWTGRSSGA